MDRNMLIRLGKANYPTGVMASAKAVWALMTGLALGHGLMWGAGLLGYALRERMESQVHDDRIFLGALMLALALAALILTAIALGNRRPPGWLCAFLMGAAASAPLTLFGVFFMASEWGGD